MVNKEEMVIQEIKVKNEFFITSLFIEEMMTSYISDKLNIQDVVNSNIVGNNITSLTFDQKIDCLIECNHFSIIDNSKLSVFKSIRNEFLANPKADTIEEALVSQDNNADFLLILYPQSEYLPREEKLTNACYQLIGEVSELVSSFTNKTEIKIKKKSMGARIYNNIVQSPLSKLSMLFAFLLLK